MPRKDASMLLSLIFDVTIRSTLRSSVFQVYRSYSSNNSSPNFNRSSRKVFRAGEDHDCRGPHRNSHSCPNYVTISKGHSRQQRSNQIHNKAPLGDIRGDGKFNIKCRNGRPRSVWTENHIVTVETILGAVSIGNPQDIRPGEQILRSSAMHTIYRIFTCCRTGLRHRFTTLALSS